MGRRYVCVCVSVRPSVCFTRLHFSVIGRALLWANVCVCVCVHCHVWCEWSVLADFPRHSCTRTGLMCNPSRHFKGAGGLDRRGPASGPDGSLWWKEHNPHPGITYALQRQTFYSQTFVFNCRKYWGFFCNRPKQTLFLFSFFQHFSPPSVSSLFPYHSHLTSLCFSIPTCFSLIPPPPFFLPSTSSCSPVFCL